MRIALVSDSYWPRVNGVTVSIQTFRDELIKRGHKVLVLVPEYPRHRRGSSGEEGVVRLPSMASGISSEDRILRFGAFPAFFKALDAFCPDVIHINTEFMMQFAGRFYARLRGYPLLLSAHTDWEEYAGNYIPFMHRRILKLIVRAAMRAIHGSADQVITPSKAMQRRLTSYGIKKLINIIPTGIPTTFCLQPPAEVEAFRTTTEQRFPYLKGKKLLIFTGRVTEEKNVKFLIPVLEEVNRQRGGDTALLVAGDGPYRAAFEEAVKTHGLGENVAFFGYIPRKDLPLVYAAADIFSFPSKTETLGLCTIEAMATGTPVVAIGEMGTRDVMDGDHGGFMVRDDVAEFSAAVLKLLGDPALMAAKSREAIEWASRFGVDPVTDKLIELYKRVAEKRQRGRNFKPPQ